MCNNVKPSLHQYYTLLHHYYSLLLKQKCVIKETYYVILRNNSNLQSHILTQLWCVDLQKLGPTHLKCLNNHPCLTMNLLKKQMHPPAQARPDEQTRQKSSAVQKINQAQPSRKRDTSVSTGYCRSGIRSMRDTSDCSAGRSQAPG